MHACEIDGSLYFDLCVGSNQEFQSAPQEDTHQLFKLVSYREKKQNKTTLCFLVSSFASFVSF